MEETAIDMSGMSAQLLPSYPRYDTLLKGISALFHEIFNGSYFEKWRLAQETIATLQNELYLVRRTLLNAERQGPNRVRFAIDTDSPTYFAASPISEPSFCLRSPPLCGRMSPDSPV